MLPKITKLVHFRKSRDTCRLLQRPEKVNIGQLSKVSFCHQAYVCINSSASRRQNGKQKAVRPTPLQEAAILKCRIRLFAVLGARRMPADENIRPTRKRDLGEAPKFDNKKNAFFLGGVIYMWHAPIILLKYAEFGGF